MKNQLESFYKVWEKYAHEYISSEPTVKANFNLLNNPQFNKLMASSPVVTFIINHTTSTYEYFSENAASILGYSAQDFLRGGVPFGMSLIDPSHTEAVGTFLIPTIFDHIHQCSEQDELESVRFSFNYKIKRKDGVSVWILEIMSIIEVDEKGGPLLSLFHLIDINAFKRDEKIDLCVHKLNENGYHTPVHISSYENNKVDASFLSQRELEILSLICKGMSSKEMADFLCLSVHTINTHRKNMLFKTRCKNSSELISFSTAKGLHLG